MVGKALLFVNKRNFFVLLAVLAAALDNSYGFVQIHPPICFMAFQHRWGSMDKKFVNKMKKQLLVIKEEILNNLAAENQEFEEMVKDLDPKDLADIAADDIDRKTLEALSSHDMKRLRLTDSALSRIKNERFGVCLRCSKKIPKARLEAIPYAFMCIDCQASDERRNR